MARQATLRQMDEAPPETDRFVGARHPRETYALFGHGEAERDVLDAYRANRLPQAFLVGGAAGIGKATLAWRLARFLLAHPDPRAAAVAEARDLAVDPDHPVSHQVEALSHGDLFLLRREWNDKTKKPFTEIRADDVRRAIHLYQRAAGAGGYRVCIVDSADDLNRSGANALLKLIEEPPPRSLFLIVAHRPGQVLPTIRSRCRLMMLRPLAQADILAAIDDLGAPWSDAPSDELAKIAGAARGSVQEALRRLDGAGLALDQTVRRLLEGLPAVDWRAVHKIADQVSSRDKDSEFSTLLGTVFDWLDDEVRARGRSGQGAPGLAPLAEAWERIAAANRETDALNLDRRQFLIGVFEHLATGMRAA